MSGLSLNPTVSKKLVWLLAVPVCLAAAGAWAMWCWGHIANDAQSPRFVIDEPSSPVQPKAPPTSRVVADEIPTRTTRETIGMADIGVRVSDASGAPIAGAHLRLESYPDNRVEGWRDSPERTSDWGVTDGSGRARLKWEADVPCGVAVFADGFLPLETRNSQDRDRDVVLRRPARVDVELVNQRTGLPVADQVVTASLSGSTRSVKVDAFGHFSVEGCPPGDQRLDIDGPGFRPTTMSIVGLAEEERRFVRVFVVEGAHLRGTVRAAGVPARGAVVSIIDRWTSRRVATAVVGPDGTFDLPVGIDGRDYVVEATDAGWFGETVMVAGGAHHVVELREPWTFELNVHDANSAIGHGRVHVVRADGLPCGPEGDGWSFHTSDVGRLRVEGLTDGVTYRVVVSADGFGVVEFRNIDRETTANAVLKCPLSSASTVNGRVVDVRGNPVPGAVVRVTRGDGVSAPALFTRADADGYYKIPGVVPGSVHVVPFHPGFDGRRRTASTAESSVDVVLQRL